MNKDNITRVLVEKYLLRYGSITPLEAWNFCHCYRLSARIYELRHDYGYGIVQNKITAIRDDGTKYQICRYTLVTPGTKSFEAERETA